MPDNEGFESQTDTEGSTDSEDIAEQKSVVQPYQFEPVADSDLEKQAKTAFFVKLLRRDSKQDVSKYAEHITDEFVGVKFGRCFRTNVIYIFRCSSFAGNLCIDIPCSLQRIICIPFRATAQPRTSADAKFSHLSSLRAGCHACLNRNFIITQTGLLL